MRIAVPLVVAAIVSANAFAQTRVSDIRVTGEHRVAPAEPPAVARQLAIVDARVKAAQLALRRVAGRADVKALHLTPSQLEAYTASLLDTDGDMPGDVAQDRVSAHVVLRLDADALARRIALLHRDQEVSVEVIAAWTRARELLMRLTQQEDRARTGTAIVVNDLAARAYAALAKTEPATVGGRATSLDGRARARRFAEAALERAPDLPEARYLLGDVLLAAGEAEAAEAQYRKALSAGPPSGRGRTKLAAALREQRKTAESLAELREAQRIDPTYAMAFSDYGLILRAEGQLEEAMAAYREAIRLDPRSAEAHNGLAVSLAYSGSRDDAVTEFRKIVEIDPDSTIGYYNLAFVLADLDRDSESAAALREVVRINPDHYNAHFNLGELFRLEGKFDDSATQFREYLRLAPDTPETRRSIARARAFVRQFEDPDAPVVPDMMAPRP
jgi:tetratricopeptide (TPR) repeat protein